MKIVLHIAIVCLFACPAALAQQAPEVTEHHKRLHNDAGNWTGTMKVYTGAPAGQPMELPIKETGKLFGKGLWVISDFEAGPFIGQGQFGYDPYKKKYVGTWIDNMNTTLAVMEGEYDESKEALVMTFMSRDPSGKPVEMRSFTKTDGTDKRNFVMQNKEGDKWVTAFEINYERAK